MVIKTSKTLTATLNSTLQNFYGAEPIMLGTYGIFLRFLGTCISHINFLNALNLLDITYIYSKTEKQL
jgi:hypothetical protein